MKRLALTIILVCLVAACRDNNVPKTSLAAPSPQAPSGATESRASPPQVSYADVIERVGPGVVTIRAARRVHAPRQLPFGDDPFFRQFFGDLFPQGRSQAPSVQMALGSGVIVKADGTILTNFHVIDGAEEIKVELTNHSVLGAKVIGTDAPSDLAVLKVNGKNLDVLSLGDSDRVRVGDIALAIGNPLGVGQTVTAGIISAKGRATGISDGAFEDFLQTDAPINQGNSGGALINTRGEVIGINSQILSPSGGNIGIGFAVPSNMARTVLDQLVKTGKVHRGQLGIAIQPMTPELAENFGLSQVRGVVINQVTPNGPAAQAGLRQGDVIMAFDGKAVEDGNTLRNQVASTAPGTKVTLTIIRDKREQQISITLGEYQARQTRREPTG